MRVLVIIIALLVASTDDPSKKGRKGNESYRNEQHSDAAQLYREGLDAAAEEKPGILAGLWNNLGASLFRTGDFQQAKDAFTNAIGFARSEEEMATFAYNAGNTTYSNANNGAQQGTPGMSPNMGAAQGSGGGGNPLEEALDFYRQAMLADPNNEDAKYNYEFVKRQLDEQQQNQDQNQENQDQQNQDQNQENQDQQNQDQNQENQDQQQQNQDEQQQNQENQDQQQQNQDQQPQDQQQQQQPDPTKLSREEAERILQALQNEEQELLRQVMKPQTRPKKVDKDW